MYDILLWRIRQNIYQRRYHPRICPPSPEFFSVDFFFFSTTHINTCCVPRYPLYARRKDKKTSAVLNIIVFNDVYPINQFLRFELGARTIILYAVPKKHIVPTMRPHTMIFTPRKVCVLFYYYFFFSHNVMNYSFYYIILEPRETFRNIPLFIDEKNILLLRNVYCHFFFFFSKRTISLDKTFIVNIL